MLVLSRQRDEKIVYIVPPSDKPTIIMSAVCDIRGDKVRIGSEAPEGVLIHRMEVWNAIKREAKAVAQVTPEVRVGASRQNAEKALLAGKAGVR